jgi:hypothetical protein
MAGARAEELAFVDLYTCFPIAAQAAALEFGLQARPCLGRPSQRALPTALPTGSFFG